MSNEQDEKWQIPKSLRIENNPEMQAAADEQQRQWSEQVNSPLAGHSPRARLRVRALSIVQELEALRDKDGLADEQKEILAESYADIGRYDLAAETTSSQPHRETYLRYWEAVNLPDEEWCPHPEKFKYVKEVVYSFKHGQEMPMLACNLCNTWNVADLPEELEAAQRRRSEVRSETRGMSMAQVKSYLQTKLRAK